MRDLLVLVPDADIEQAMKGLLVRTDSIDIAPMDFEIRRHVNRDSGCRTNAANFLRPYLRAYHYALVIFDRHGCGSRGTREEIQEEVEIDLTRNGWEGRSKAIVIDPELEVWVWSRSPIVAEVLGWDTDFEALRRWLESEDLWAPNRCKPQDPKDAMRRAMEEARLPKKARRSSSKFHDLATAADFTDCDDPAFVDLTRTLRAWFPPEAER